MTTRTTTVTEVPNPIRIDRKLPPHELNARRRRKRNLTGKPTHQPSPQSPIPTAGPGSPAAHGPASDCS